MTYDAVVILALDRLARSLFGKDCECGVDKLYDYCYALPPRSDSGSFGTLPIGLTIYACGDSVRDNNVGCSDLELWSRTSPDSWMG
ncbi:hypothetical protein DTO027B5_1955 [Paecilomyces variotii]|nr:hypothetical protein DTO169C6_949 [Paecilomyces variotii]KAJ9267740.1 hypothetical protein DTO195F2_74 [Paecilomyces variotii]KAJ9287553.1 hypothetical protein DTO021C3_4846 [Paecilomyces variotii]KAJ9327567.1 hypothetical protein DTO027B3_1789 [Paecilomyces variotii]KAJ9336274.1 hypothetical protein DTO027B5_1955 [Paecilomyces variotii]